MHRKTLYNWFSLLTCLAVVFSCASKKEDGHDHDHVSASSDGSVWKEMDDFHMIMAETFHPYKDSSNLEPVRTRASELFAAADEWASASLPEKVDTQEVRSKLQQLKEEAATLAETVKSSDDNVIAQHLTKLHDTFHSIQEEWYGGR
jgi:hypothetical protein